MSSANAMQAIRDRNKVKKSGGGKWDVDLRALETYLLEMDRSSPDFAQLMKLYMAAHWRSALGIRDIEDDNSGDGLLEEDEWVTYWTNMTNPENPSKSFHSHSKFMMSEEMALMSFDWVFRTANKVFFTKVVINKKGKVNMREADRFAQKCQTEWRKLAGNLQRFKSKAWYASIVKRESDIVYEEDLKDNEDDEPPPEEPSPATEEPSPQTQDDDLEARLREELEREYNERLEQEKKDVENEFTDKMEENERMKNEAQLALEEVQSQMADKETEMEAERQKTAELETKNQALEDEMAAAQRELENARQQIEALTQGKESQDSDTAQVVQDLQTQLAEKDNEMQQEREKAMNLDAQNKALQEQLELAQQQNEQMAQEKETERNRMEQEFANKMQESETAMAELQAKITELEAGNAKADESDAALCECEKARAELTAKVEELEQELQRKLEETSALNDQVSASNDEIARLNEKATKDEQNHQQEVDRLQSEIDILRNGQNDEADLAAQLSELKRQIAEKDNQIQEQNEITEDLRGKLEESEQVSRESKNEQDRLAEELERLRRELQESQAQQAITQSELASSQKTMADQKNENDQLKEELERLRRELQESRNQQANAQKTIEDQQSEIDRLREQIRYLESSRLEDRKQMQEESVAQSSNDSSDLLEQIRLLTNERDSFRSTAERLAQQSEGYRLNIERLENSNDALRNKIREVEKERDEARSYAERMKQENEQNRQTIVQLQEEIERLKSQLKSSNDTIHTLQERIVILERQIRDQTSDNTANSNTYDSRELEQLKETNERQEERIRELEDQLNDVGKNNLMAELVVMPMDRQTTTDTEVEAEDLFGKREKDSHPIVIFVNVVAAILWVVWFALYLIFVASGDSVVQAIWYITGLLALGLTFINLFYSCCQPDNGVQDDRHTALSSSITEHGQLLFIFVLCHLYFWFLIVGYFNVGTNIDSVRAFGWLCAAIATYVIVLHFLWDAYPLKRLDLTHLELSKWDIICPAFISVAVGLICHGLYFAIDPMLRPSGYFSELENLLVWKNQTSSSNVVGLFVFFFIARPFVSQLYLRMLQYISQVFCQRICIDSCGSCSGEKPGKRLLEKRESVAVEAETSQMEYGLPWLIGIFSLVGALFTFSALSNPSSKLAIAGEWIWVILLSFSSIFLFVTEYRTNSNFKCCGNRSEMCDLYHSDFIPQLFVGAACGLTVLFTLLELFQPLAVSAVLSLLLYCVFNVVQWYFIFFVPEQSLAIHSNILVLLSSFGLHLCSILSSFVFQFQIIWSLINQNSTQWKIQSITSGHGFVLGFFFVSLEYHSQMMSKIYSYISRI